MILTDRDIIELANHFGRPLTKPFDIKHVTPNGYDLSIAEIKIMDNTANEIMKTNLNEVYHIEDGDLMIPGRTFVIGMTEEFVEMPADMVAELWIRHSFGRKGLILAASLVDAGYHGKIALTMYNCSNNPIIIKKDEKRTICQIKFEKLDTMPLEGYAMRSGHYQNQVSLK